MTTTIKFSVALTAIAAVFALAFAFALPVSAHQAVNFDPQDPACMGKLTSFHAKDDGGIKNSAENWPHRGAANRLGTSPADGTVKSFQKLNKAWCDSEE
jgi:hypothetical protein